MGTDRERREVKEIQWSPSFMSHLVGHGLPSQDVINTTEGSFTHTHTHTNRYYVTGTTTREQKGKAGHDHNKAEARWICCCLDEDIAQQTF